MIYAVRDDAERIHVWAWTDLYDAAPPPFVDATGLRVGTPGEGIRQFFLPAVPYRMFNRVLGLGVFAPADDATIDAALNAFDDAGCEAFAFALTPGAQPQDLADRLAARGLTPLDEWALLTRTPEPIAAPPTDLRLVEATPEAFGQTLARGYEVPDEMAFWAGGLVGRPGWTTLLACEGDTPVGCAAMYLHDDLAWFGPAATLPAARGRGAQSALFARRIALAAEAGCRLLVTEALPDTPETPNPSYRNMLRAGFVEQYRRINYGRAA